MHGTTRKLNVGYDTVSGRYCAPARAKRKMDGGFYLIPGRFGVFPEGDSKLAGAFDVFLEPFDEMAGVFGEILGAYCKIPV